MVVICYDRIALEESGSVGVVYTIHTAPHRVVLRVFSGVVGGPHQDSGTFRHIPGSTHQAPAIVVPLHRMLLVVLFGPPLRLPFAFGVLLDGFTINQLLPYMDIIPKIDIRPFGWIHRMHRFRKHVQRGY